MTNRTYHCVGNVRMCGPDVTLREERPHIGPPRVPSPTQDLFQEPPVRLHGTQQLGFLAALNVRRPAVGNHPPSQELVVARVQVIFAQPVIVGEPVKEFGVLENDCPVCGGTTG